MAKAIVAAHPFATRRLPSHRPDFDHVGHEMLQQVLDAVLQRRGRGRAARAGALHVEIDDPSLKPRKVMSPPSLATAGRTRVSIRSLICLDRLGIGLVEELVFLVGHLVARRGAVGQQRRAGHIVLHDGAEDRGLQMLPVAVRPW